MRPRALASLLSALTARAPSRLVKKLDAAPRVADAWAWEGEHVTTDSGETVVLTLIEGVVRDAQSLRCSCLLSPRCFHILAVAAALDVEELGYGSDAKAQPARLSEPTNATTMVPLTQELRSAASKTLDVVDAWLGVGTSGAGAVLQGELLRVAHEARLEGGHRLAGAALRVVRGARALRAEKEEFSSQALVDDLRELATAAHIAATRLEAPANALGLARRDYQEVGNLRLHGVACEPVVARGGYAGVTSYVCDEGGVVYTISDILPADASRARGAYDLPVTLGDTALSHRELTRSGLFVQGATASADLRLGAGKGVKAVRANTVSNFASPGLSQLFEPSLDAQLDRAFAALNGESAALPKSASLVFVRATVLGGDGTGVAVSVEGHRLCLAAADDHPLLAYRDNLRLLTELVGRELRVVGHIVPQRARTLAPIAIEAGATTLALPEPFGRRANLGLDSLSRSQLVAPKTTPLELTSPPSPDPLATVRRRLIGIALGGTRALPPEALTRIDRERAALAAALMPAAAMALGVLAAACTRATNPKKGQLPRLYESFLALSCYERAATLSLQRAAFRV